MSLQTHEIAGSSFRFLMKSYQCANVSVAGVLQRTYKKCFIENEKASLLAYKTGLILESIKQTSV
jgi:hypothetical protein